MYRKEKKEEKKIGLLVDGPNILRREFAIDLEDIRRILDDLGDIRIAKVFLNQFASQGLIEAISNQGFDVIIVTGDTDVRIGVDAMEVIFMDSINTVALATRDADFLPILIKAKEHGKETIVIGADPGFSVALQNAADYVIKMGGEEVKRDDEVYL
ncbi:MAG TPA: TIGR00288 family NYN domain-containing protein [Methanomicrobia archaeon]|nr:MAG: TIGR00288 family NYN domain-containing protein [archaeon]HHN82156.1 TIGR00288 family NYN domain-containing protein [Methanomicrobia archaeon]